MQGLIDAISNLFNGNDILATIVMSFIPLIELKGGIVFAWGILPFYQAFLFAYLGSTVAFFLVFFLLRPILNLLKKWKAFNKFALKVEGYFQDKANETIEKQKLNPKRKALSDVQIKQLAVFIFVSIPLPMTGVWTGTAIAVFFNLKFKEAVLPIVVGNFIAGLLICALSALCKVIGIPLDLVLWILLALALVLFIVFIVKIVRQKSKS